MQTKNKWRAWPDLSGTEIVPQKTHHVVKNTIIECKMLVCPTAMNFLILCANLKPIITIIQKRAEQ